MANLIFLTLFAAALGQAAWLRLLSDSVEAWSQLGPRLVALFFVMGITLGVKRALAEADARRIPVMAYASLASATLGLIAVVTYSAYYIVISGGDAGWCLIAILCVVAQGLATAPIIRARRLPQAL